MDERKDDGEYFKAGDRVFVNGRGPNDGQHKGRTGTFVRYAHTGAGNYAVVALDSEPKWLDQSNDDRWFMHPESIDVMDSYWAAELLYRARVYLVENDEPSQDAINALALCECAARRDADVLLAAVNAL